MSAQPELISAHGSRFGVIGDNTIDVYERGGARTSFVGGNAVNVAVNLALAGAACSYLGAIGGDAGGERVRSALNDRGIDTSRVVVLDGHTSVTMVRVKLGGDREFVSEDFAVCADYVPDDRALRSLAECAVVHLGMVRSGARIRQYLCGRGVLVSQDCAVTQGFGGLDIAFCSAGEDTVRARSLAREAITGGAKLCIVTCGASGSVAYDGSTWWTQPAVPIDPVDTTGAGDSYIAGFLTAVAEGAAVPEAMTRGTRAAAQTCLRVGAWPQSVMPFD